MNKKLDRLTGQRTAEKMGKGWALTSFVREAWVFTKEELLQEEKLNIDWTWMIPKS
jgi:hypothetical protein